MTTQKSLQTKGWFTMLMQDLTLCCVEFLQIAKISRSVPNFFDQTHQHYGSIGFESILAFQCIATSVSKALHHIVNSP